MPRKKNAQETTAPTTYKVGRGGRKGGGRGGRKGKKTSENDQQKVSL